MPDAKPEPGTKDQDAAETSVPTGRQRLVAALFKPSRSQVVVAVLLALVAFGGITQVRANDVDDSLSGRREQDLIDILSGLAGTTQRAQAEVARLERTREELQSDTTARQAALVQAQKEADTLSILAGLVAVTGPGIRITIKEIDGQVSINSLLDTVQELRTAGAESMQFNGQLRIIAQSSFEDAEGGIAVDGELLSAPYVIDVIGEPHTLAGAITFATGPRDQLQDDGAEVEIQELTSLDIESVRDPVAPDFAQPDLEQ